MKTILFTQSNSLYNLWQGYGLGNDVSIVTNKNEFVKLLRIGGKFIVGIDENTLEDVAKFIKELVIQNSDIKVLVLTNEPKFEKGKLLLALGAKGYANSHMQDVHFIDAINTIASGNVWIYPEFIQNMIAEMNATTTAKSDGEQVLSELNDKEKDIAMLIKKGLSNKDIAEAIGITLRMVKAHTTSIYAKVGVKDRIGLVLLMQNLDA